MTVVEYKGMWWDPADTVAYPDIVPSTMAINEKTKLAFKGHLTLNFHLGSRKYSPEAVLSIYSPVYPIVKERASNNNWARLELPLPVCAATREFFLECARAVDAKLKGIE